MAGALAFTSFAPVGNLIGITSIEVQADTTIDTSWYDDCTEGQTEFHISNEAQLRGLAKIVNETNMAVENAQLPFIGCTIYLDNDINMTDEEFAPIGLSSKLGFAGTFDGRGHTIKNLMISKVYDSIPTNGLYAGLFGSVIGVSAESPATIKNINLEGVNVLELRAENVNVLPISRRNKAKQGTGALVGYGKNIIIENCNIKDSYVENTAVSITGGMIGLLNGGSISNCTVSNTDVKGIYDEGLLGGKISKPDLGCKNNKVDNVSVQGTVTETQKDAPNTGGLFGSNMDTNGCPLSNIVVEKNTTVIGTSNVGGITGKNWGELQNCVNYAEVTARKNLASGITPEGGKLAKYTNCINYGAVTGEEYVAGITTVDSKPKDATTINVENCYNLGNIKSSIVTTKIGALAYFGQELFSVTNSYNLGNVEDSNGPVAQFDESNSYSNVAYNLENGLAFPEGTEVTGITGITGYTTEQFKDRTVVVALNHGNDEKVWCQNTDYPDLAFNMILVSEITVPDTLSIAPGKTLKLQTSVTPDDATVDTLLYSSSDEKIATVSEDGTVKGIKEGKAEITVKALDSGLSKTVKVTVKEPEPEKQPSTPSTPSQPSAPATDNNTVASGTTVTVGTNNYIVIDNTSVAYAGTTNTKATKISIPATVKIGAATYKVTSVSANAFKGNKKIKSVTIGSNVTSIGKAAFANCKKLTSVVIGKNVKTIGSKAFYGCSKLKKITVKSKVLKKVGSKAFKGIHKNAVIKVPSKKLKAYKKLLKGKGQKSSVNIK